LKKMATIGLDRLFYSKITEDENGEETYAPPVMLAKAMTAGLSISLAEAVLYADDTAAEIVKEFQSGTLTLGIDDIGRSVAQDLTGAATDDNGVLVSTGEDIGMPVAVGFRARKPNGSYRYFWFYRVKFGIPAANLQTKGDSISFQTPTIEGMVMRRNKQDAQGRHPWKAEVTEGDPGVPASVINGWYTEVYEPMFSAEPETGGDSGNPDYSGEG
jgi:phi13 family phage major tail protein